MDGRENNGNKIQNLGKEAVGREPPRETEDEIVPAAAVRCPQQEILGIKNEYDEIPVAFQDTT